MLLDLSNSFDANKAIAYLDKLTKKGKRCEIKEVRNQRTNPQNSYLHVCLAMFCAETGYTIDEAKELFSTVLPDLMRYQKNGISFRRSTSELDTKEMTVLIDKIREVALDQIGIYIPTSEEYLINKFQIDRELELQGINYGK